MRGVEPRPTGLQPVAHPHELQRQRAPVRSFGGAPPAGVSSPHILRHNVGTPSSVRATPPREVTAGGRLLRPQTNLANTRGATRISVAGLGLPKRSKGFRRHPPWTRSDSNRQPPHCKCGALPLELQARFRPLWATGGRNQLQTATCGGGHPLPVCR
jgi:hypothetical protein